jgi:hypothetical protein
VKARFSPWFTRYPAHFTFEQTRQLLGQRQMSPRKESFQRLFIVNATVQRHKFEHSQPPAR